MDNYILTEQEAKTQVTFGDLQIVLEELRRTLCDMQENNDKVLVESLEKVIDTLVERINKLYYQQVRDMKFCLELFSEVSHFSKDVIDRTYDSWCKEFDKLNKRED